jgi:hypothetical protein
MKITGLVCLLVGVLVSSASFASTIKVTYEGKSVTISPVKVQVRLYNGSGSEPAYSVLAVGATGGKNDSVYLRVGSWESAKNLAQMLKQDNTFSCDSRIKYLDLGYFCYYFVYEVPGSSN